MTDKTDREIMQMALEALYSAPLDHNSIKSSFFERRHHAIIALRERLTQPEQEPVACIVKGCSNHRGEGLFIGELCSPCHTFITTGEGKYSQAYRNSQREWQGLTDEEIYECEKVGAIHYQRHKCSVRGQQLTPADDPQWHFAGAIEAKLKEKND